MFSSLTTKAVAICSGILIVIALAAVGTLTYKLSSAREEAAAVELALTQEKAALATAESANASLSKQIGQIRAISDLQVKENAALQARTDKIQTDLSSAVAKISDASRNQRIAKIRAGKSADLLLGYINRDVACEVQHFTDQGECKMGEWVQR